MTKTEKKFIYLLIGLVLFLVGGILFVGALGSLREGGDWFKFVISIFFLGIGGFLFRHSKNV